MSSLIEKIAKKPIIITQPTGEYDDGKPVSTSIMTTGFLTEFAKADFDIFGRIRGGKIVLVPPLERDPMLPGQIVIDNIFYTIMSVRPCRNLAGKLQGYRIAVAGAEG